MTFVGVGMGMDYVRKQLLRVVMGLGGKVFSARTLEMMIFDLKRWLARLKNRGKRGLRPAQSRLHLGCGWRHVAGWLNVDVRHSDHDVDLAGGRLPWADGVFTAVVSQHAIEHLELMSELLPLLREIYRVTAVDAEVWLSCPDIEKLIHSYQQEQMTDLLRDRIQRIPSYELGPMPTNHLLNDIFYAKGEHRNLFDFTLLNWALAEANFQQVEPVVEADLLARFPEFPPRHDDRQTLYVKAIK